MHYLQFIEDSYLLNKFSWLHACWDEQFYCSFENIVSYDIANTSILISWFEKNLCLKNKSFKELKIERQVGWRIVKSMKKKYIGSVEYIPATVNIYDIDSCIIIIIDSGNN